VLGKREFSGACAVFKHNQMPIAPHRVTQNAGCMMAIHANCTKSKILIFCNSLIYKEFFNFC